MKKTFKTTLLLLAVTLFMAGCKPSTPEENEPSIETDTIELSDGNWFADTETTNTISANGASQTTKMKQHIEFTISGDEIDITKATFQTNDGTVQDFTEEVKDLYKSASDIEDPISTSLNRAETASAIPINTSTIQPTVKIYKNEDSTEYKIIIQSSIKFSDLLDFSDPTVSSMYAQIGITGDMTSENKSVTTYKKQN